MFGAYAFRRSRTVWLAATLACAVALISDGPGAASHVSEALAQGASRPSPGPIVQAFIARVIEGDTVEAHIAGRRVAVGLLGATAPGIKSPCGDDAASRLRSLIGRNALLEEDGGALFDRLGRRLYHVYTGRGASVEETLIREGLARGNVSGKYQAYLNAVEVDARTARRGCLWRAARPPIPLRDAAGLVRLAPNQIGPGAEHLSPIR